MDRVEKIGTILLMVALVATLAHSHRRRGHQGKLTGVSVNTPDLANRRGPVYLLAALPEHRRRDDYADPVSYFANGSETADLK